jgi:hypothetical protein
MAEPIYITKQNYYDFSGIDLQLELKGSNYDNIGDMVDIFLSRLETWMLEYLESNYYMKIDNEDFNQEAFIKSCLYQIDYLRRNGDLSVQAVNTAPLLSPNSKMVLKNAGMLNVSYPRKLPIDPWL